MQRKIANKSGAQSGMKNNSMAVKDRKSMEAAKAAMPFFGGTSPTETESESESSTTETSEKPSESANGTSTEIATDPQAVADLVKQVESLNNTVGQLKKVNEKFESEKKTKERESMGREEALSRDLEEAQQTIVKMDQALRNQAVVNAINGFKDIEFHDIKFAMSKLSSDVFDQMEVDLANGTVTVTGIENDLRRIAKENEWAVKNKGSVTANVNGSEQRRVPAARPSGGAPSGAGGDASKATARKALAARFPVITHGRSI